ncbi:adenosylcobinamide-GDP ribazoletransferase [Ferrovibrio sp.]|uniref:adenosylcobinamide-GDP ribazoletransferase n=1 Tax=Ferrovibrio sp. TaxID=1917215 RepID=UPI0025C25183|nr:adenosylcobinamide-GDP ribazoletransferase [Ferrovibrio sp.]MBX3454021.1 adenosylcobinamide-GDP ribazoletransferase [Ferrovibrio sp.]
MAPDTPPPPSETPPESASPSARHGLRARWHEFLLALTILTRLPLPAEHPGKDGVAEAAWAFAPVGAVIGLVSGLVFIAATWLGLGVTVSLILAIGAQIVLTGALHERGLAATADAVMLGDTVQKRVAQLSENRLAAAGLLALIAVLSLRHGALAELASELIAVGDDFEATASYGVAVTIAFILSGAASRVVMAWVWNALPSAREEDAELDGHVTLRAALIGTGIVVALAALLLSWRLFVVMAIGLTLLTLAAIGLLRQQFGGQAAQPLGGVQQSAEIFVLLCLSVMAVPV